MNLKVVCSGHGQYSLSHITAIWRYYMDLLTKCACTFRNLTGYRYHFTLGHKGKLKELSLGFSDTNFHHLIGLHKLKDLEIARTNRSTVFQEILNKRITYETLRKSEFFDEIQSRLEAFPYLEALLDQEPIVFRYNKKLYPYSRIESEFLIKLKNGTCPDITFLFLDQTKHDIYYCRSFFPMNQTDYTRGQMQYTLLKTEKIHMATGKIICQHDRLASKSV